jgi:hypothetical protein
VASSARVLYEVVIFVSGVDLCCVSLVLVGVYLWNGYQNDDVMT